MQAPFIGFLEERRVHKTENDGSIELLFGCRNHDSFIYKDELDMFKYDATLVRDFSLRLKKNNTKQIYHINYVIQMKGVLLLL